MPKDDFPSKCPGCKQKFSKRRQWERHRCHLLKGTQPPDVATSPVEDDRAEQEEACATASV